MSAHVHLEAVKGEDVIAYCTHKTLSTGAGVAVDINGWHVQFNLRAALGDPDTGSPAGPLLQVEAEVATGTTGTYTITLTSAQTMMLAAGVYVFDIWRTDAGSERQMAHGTFTIGQGVKYS